MATQIANSLSTGGSPSALVESQPEDARRIHVDFEANGSEVDIESKTPAASNWATEATLSGDSGDGGSTAFSPMPVQVRANVTSGTVSVWVE